MVLDKTREIAQRYYNDHKVSQEKIGVANLIQSGNYTLEATPQGGMFLRSKGDFRDCYVAAVCLKADIELNNPELKPTIRQYRRGHNQQNFVAITDPHTDDEIFIDTTPWANSVHTPYPNSVEIVGENMPTGAPLRFGHLIPYSVRRNGEEVTTFEICGWLPKICDGSLFRNLDYLFMISQSKQSAFDNGEMNPWRFFIGVEDIEKFVSERRRTNGAFELYQKTDLTFGVLNVEKGECGKIKFDEFFSDGYEFLYDPKRNRSQFQEAIRIMAKLISRCERELDLTAFGKKTDVRRLEVSAIELAVKYADYVKSINRKVERNDAKRRFV
jgi:hypothetical protein